MKWTMHDPETWDYEDINDGRYAAFVYMITFDDGSYYFGVKSIFKSIRDVKKLKPTTKESNWENYYSSSKKVQAMVDSGLNYEKQILWCFRTTNEAEQVEAALILFLGQQSNNLNLAVMCKVRLGKNHSETFKVLQQLLERLS